MSHQEVRERAYAKVNLVLHVGRPRPADGLHPISSVFASIDLADDLAVRQSDGSADEVYCPGVDGPNLAAAALKALRDRVPSLPPLQLEITKRIPVAAGLGGGSADAAATLRAANTLAGDPLDGAALHEIAAGLGSDVPSQVDPRHSIVTGVGEVVEPVGLPPLRLVLVPQEHGLSTAEVYARLDAMQAWRDHLDPGAATAAIQEGAYENDLQPVALALRPELAAVLERLEAAGARAALVSGSGPTCFGVFEDTAAADAAADQIPGAMVARLRST